MNHQVQHKTTHPDQILLGRVMPHAIDAEQAVLGGILIDKDGIGSVLHLLKPESFYKNKHSVLYEAMTGLFEKSIAIDLITMREALMKANKLEEVGGLNYLLHLSNIVASSANIEHHARIVAQKFIQRELIRVSTDSIKESYADEVDVFEMLDKAEQGLYSITDSNVNTGYALFESIAVKTRRQIEEVSKRKNAVTGVPSGFKELDKITAGWQKSDLVIIAARPGMGKTAFTLSLARNATMLNKAVAIFSLEMSNTQLVQRLLSMDANINSQKLRTGRLNKEEWLRLGKSIETLSETPIVIDDTPALNIFELRAKCRRIKQTHDVELIIIDYLQLMSGPPNQKRQNREQEISGISRALKGLAKELNIPVIALSQLSRAVETRGGTKRPILSDLRESGAIEQDADIVTFIYRPGYYDMDEDFDKPKDLAEIIIAKHRSGSLGTVELKFVSDFVRFEEFSSDNLFTIGKKGFVSPSELSFEESPF